ncbi:MAG: hypothetical protein OXD30_14005 [Bryobacterales bacterium]|nr:hypothetical protein [Bryobacterales bacterium]
MLNSTAKKVYVRRFGLDRVEGWVDPQQYLRGDGVELMTRSAKTVLIPYDHVRAVYFVRDFDKNPERDLRKEFVSRPKLVGLWIRVRFVDGGELEGVIPNNLSILCEPGVTLTPPDSNGLTRRVFVPQVALETCVVMGVIGKPEALRRRPRVPKLVPGQIGLFEAPA